MTLFGHVQAIQGELAAAGELGDELTAEAARGLSRTLGSSLQLSFLDLLGEVAVALSAQLTFGRIEVRLSGGEPELIFVEDEVAELRPARRDSDVSVRITVRLSETLKARADTAAAEEGSSTNAWIVSAIERTLEAHDRHPRIGRHLLSDAGS